eukprot:876394-Pyramimonas_sp.AAC.1
MRNSSCRELGNSSIGGNFEPSGNECFSADIGKSPSTCWSAPRPPPLKEAVLELVLVPPAHVSRPCAPSCGHSLSSLSVAGSGFTFANHFLI